MFPVRCYTCNTVLAHLHAPYDARLREGRSAREALAEAGVERMCCRRMFLGFVDLMRDQIDYPNVDVRLDESGTTLRRHVAQTREVSCD